MALGHRRYSELPRLIEAAQALPDRHEAYVEQREVLASSLQALDRVPRERLGDLLAGTASAALAALEREPSEPLFLGWAGVALYELWALDGAGALFDAAFRLDPDLEHLIANRDALTRRREQLAGQAPPALHASVPALTRRALAVAKRAQPAQGLTLSLCMIVRDEELMLPRCLEAARPAVDEIVIVDTGSRDSTIEIARSFGATVIEHPWRDSFAEARNVSFEAAHGDWLMYLDADEVLVAEDASLLRSLAQRTWREAFYLRETSYTRHEDAGTSLTHDALRVFRNRPAYRFSGRLHEQIAQTLPGDAPERIERTPVRVEHFGYLSAQRQRKRKSSRNLELLRREASDGKETAFLRFNLGTEHAAAGDAEDAARELGRAWQLLEGDPKRFGYSFAPSLARTYVDALHALDRNREAIAIADQALAQYPGYTDLVLRQAEAYADLGEHERALELCARCLELGETDRRYTGSAGAGTFLPRTLMGRLLLERGDAGQAAALLLEALSEHPAYADAVLPCAQALLARGDSPEEVVRTIEETLGTPSSAARFMLGTALYEAGAPAHAEAQFEATLAADPEAAEARVALAEAQLAGREYGRAAQTAATVPAESPLAVAACRSELFARILLRDAAVEAALERAAEAGMPRAELELFALWRDLSRGREGRERLEQGAASTLLLVLEALLRVGELAEIELLLPALSRTPLSARERSHRLAEIYWRRGFPRSAAREWMSICSEAPDAPALAGLALVAQGEGMEEQARELAQQALARDPANERARSLLAAATTLAAAP
jgi:glycosyltransferase involved in cell wall biosynthesis/thioredoxin-like negative regulator of GroEL